ncbi:hypothetical protein OPV22_015237 [Ensete ventricosum]|uniref:Uncharacterized protein n=1 Tax=Ensete ventricosum TaxID=4639 RepID=A0AAV8RDP1_ENSVE|nr:hypothetical protein OPV22_015237 [Ensete ventricosum]
MVGPRKSTGEQSWASDSVDEQNCPQFDLTQSEFGRSSILRCTTTFRLRMPAVLHGIYLTYVKKVCVGIHPLPKWFALEDYFDLI